MEFKHLIDESEDIEDLSCTYKVKNDRSGSEIVLVSKDENGQMRLVSNKSGWEYLAKVCAEMDYLAERDPLFHSHRDSRFKFSNDQKADAIGLFQISKHLELKELNERRRVKT